MNPIACSRFSVGANLDLRLVSCAKNASNLYKKKDVCVLLSVSADAL
jgi:hypothetical protein